MSARLRIGAGFLGHLAGAVTVGDYVEAAIKCEAVGLDSFWVADQRWVRDPWVTLTAVAENTTDILIGTRITDPYIRHPAVTAVSAATLDEHSGGRFVLGLGAGGSGFGQIGLQRHRPVAALREATQLIRQLWAGNGAIFEGELISWSGGTLGFETRADIPIVIASRGPKLLAMAGETADGVIIASGTATSSIEWATAQVQQGAERAGRSMGDIELMHQTYVSVDDDYPERAVQAAKKGIVGAVVGSFPTFDFLSAVGLEAPNDLYQYLEGGSQDPDTIVSLIPDEFVETLTAAGSSRTVTKKILSMADAGIGHVLVAAIPSGDEGELCQLGRFLRDVLPKVR